MEFITNRFFGILLVAISLVLFLVEAKALPHNPKNPEKWDALHAKYYRVIKFSKLIFLLLGLTFVFTGGGAK